MLRLDLQGENSGSDLRWLDPAMAALERRSLPRGVAAGEHLSLLFRCQETVGVDAHCCSSSIVVLITLGFFFFLHLGIASLLYDLALCQRYSLCARIGVGRVHPSHAEAGCVLFVFISPSCSLSSQ